MPIACLALDFVHLELALQYTEWPVGDSKITFEIRASTLQNESDSLKTQNTIYVNWFLICALAQ